VVKRSAAGPLPRAAPMNSRVRQKRLT